jgi:hypothetical protein
MRFSPPPKRAAARFFSSSSMVVAKAQSPRSGLLPRGVHRVNRADWRLLQRSNGRFLINSG